MMNKVLLVIAALTLGACTSPEPDLDELAREYLFLELSMGQHDEAHVDAYFGPEELRTAAEETALTLDQILTASQDLAARLAAIDAQDTMLVMRIDALLARLRALDTRIAINKGEYLDFDDESLALFGSRAPQYDAAHFQDILDRIDALKIDADATGDLHAALDRLQVQAEVCHVRTDSGEYLEDDALDPDVTAPAVRALTDHGDARWWT